MNAKEILNAMTLEEKAAFCSGRDFWHTKAIERLGVPSVMMCDGPHGLRKQEGEGDHLGINKSIETVCYPTAAALASSFDRDVMRQACRRSELRVFLRGSVPGRRDGRFLCKSAAVERRCRLRKALCLQQPGDTAYVRLVPG